MGSTRSRFIPSSNAKRILTEGNIFAPGESGASMIERVVRKIFEPEKKFGTDAGKIEKLQTLFTYYLDNRYCIMSTPVMTNAGRYAKKPLSACAVPAVSFNKKRHSDVKKIINRFHSDGMGTGFNLNECEDPTATLDYLNAIAVEGAQSGREDRPVGNMAVLSVHHPRIKEFIISKANPGKASWKFNISIDASKSFIEALKKDNTYRLWDNSRLKASSVMKLVAESAHQCGDPGLVFLHRMNAHNPTPTSGSYTSTAPCGEVGLAPGETCQFGYINVAKFSTQAPAGPRIDFDALADITKLMTRALDNIVEVSLGNFSQKENRRVMQEKRKIGIGICGLADLFILLGIPYESPEARNIGKDVVAFINYQSKVASHELAKTRGSFAAMKNDPECKYLRNPGYLTTRYGSSTSSSVSRKDWLNLDEKIRETRLLRNATTISLPPTGRSALIIDASYGVEPLFSLDEHLAAYPKDDYQLNELKRKKILKTALEIHPRNHLLMAASLQAFVDEAISKTINLPTHTEVETICRLYAQACSLNLKGVTVYRDKCRAEQPKIFAKK